MTSRGLTPQKTIFFFIAAFIWLAACAPLLTVEQTASVTPETIATPFPTRVLTPVLENTPDLWKSHPCDKTKSVFSNENPLIWRYVGDMAGRGRVDILLNITENNEIRGFVFDFEKVKEYRATGCVADHAFIMWLQQSDNIDAVIIGEFPETDPRGFFPSDKRISPYILTGTFKNKDNTPNSVIYLRLERADGGTMEHRFRLEGIKDDRVILEASRQFLTAVSKDDRAQVVNLVRFPLQVLFEEEKRIIQNPDALLAQ